MTTPIRKLIGSRLRTYRNNRELTQSTVAEAIGCDLTTLSRYERGEFAPDGEQLVKLAKYFNVSPLDFLPGDIEIHRQSILDNRAKLIELAYRIEDPNQLQMLVDEAIKYADDGPFPTRRKGR